MTEEKKGTEEIVEETTTQEVPPVSEEKPAEETPKEEGKEEITPEELETLRKKAADFDGMVEKQRLAKLAKRDAPKETKPEATTIDMEAVKQAAEEVAKSAADARIIEHNKSTYEENLGIAYKRFIQNNKWADDDGILARISENFKRGSALTPEELQSQLDKAALELFPKEYAQGIEDRVKNKVLVEESNIDAGGSGAEVSTPKVTTEKVEATPEDIRVANKYFNGDVERYLKTKG